MLRFDRKQQNPVKQLSFNKKLINRYLWEELMIYNSYIFSTLISVFFILVSECLLVS